MSRPAGHGARLLWPACLWLALGSCAALAANKAPQEYLDEDTAATVTVVAEPLVFANPRTDLGANVRDYVTLAAAAVDRNGKVSYVLIAYFWSTVDPRVRQDAPPSPETLVVQADDRRIQLSLRGHSAHEAGIGMPVHVPPGSDAPPQVYGSDLGTLRFMAEARHLALAAESDGTEIHYDLWEDRRTALRSLVRHMSGED